MKIYKNKTFIFFIYIISFVLFIYFLYKINQYLSIENYQNNYQTNQIPKMIYQTHKNQLFIENHPSLKNAQESWKKNTKKGFQYKFYDDKHCDDFMKINYPGKIYKIYKKLPLGVMKSDLWRYCVIYQYGGIYADVDTICKMNVNDFIVTVDSKKGPYLVCTPELGSNLFCQWVFAAPPKSPILKSIIDTCIEKLEQFDKIKNENKHKQKQIVYQTTGPKAFTNGILKYIQTNHLKVYPSMKDYCHPKKQIQQMKVFEPNDFHKKKVIHLYFGLDKDGWKKEAIQSL
jgi:mannosyltransferase OCH1-like enzyme